VTRVTTLGELTATIAHEINQPLAAAVTDANASLRWLAGDSPNLTEAREAIRRIIRNGNRAGEIIGRIRALAKKAPPKKDWLDLNETIVRQPTPESSHFLRNPAAPCEIATEAVCDPNPRIEKLGVTPAALTRINISPGPAWGARKCARFRQRGKPAKLPVKSTKKPPWPLKPPANLHRFRGQRAGQSRDLVAEWI
jgi:hypothetical protein